MFIYKDIERIYELKDCYNSKEKRFLFNKNSEVSKKMKQPKTVEELIEILESKTIGHSVIFSDEERTKAKIFLSYTNYYRFSVFPRLIRIDEKRTFTNVLHIYEIDTFLCQEINRFSKVIEIWVKTSLAKSLVFNYNSTDYEPGELYLDLNIYNSEKNGKKVITSFSETVRNSKASFIKHHIEEKENCIPLWALVEVLTFGQIETFFSALTNQYKIQWIDECFGINNRNYIASWLNVIRYLRNASAHFGRFYGNRFTTLPKITDEDKKNYAIRNDKKANLFVMLLTVRNILVHHPDKIRIALEWNNFIDKLEEIIKEQLFDLELNDFPTNWYNALHIAIDDK